MIVEDILNFINSKTTSYAQIFVDVLEDGEAIAIRQMPSNNKSQGYMDKSRTGEFDFEMITKSNDQQKAIDQLEVYEDLLDLPSFFILTDQCSIKIEPLVSIRFIGTADDLRTTYASTFRVEYIKERN